MFPNKQLLVPPWILVVVAIVFTGLTTTCSAQQPQAKNDLQDLILRQTRFLKFSKRPNGDLVGYSENTGSVSPIEFFVHPDIVAELELDSAAVKQMESCYATFEREFQSLLSDQLPTANPKSAQDALTNLTAKFFVDVESNLSLSDRNRLRQIQLQFLLYRLGPHQFLANPDIKKLLSLPDFSLRQLGRKQTKLRNTLLANEKSFVTEAIDIWLEPLSDKQRAIFDREWKSAYSKSGALSLLILSFRSDHEFYLTKHTNDEIVIAWQKMPTLRHAASGNVEWVSPDTNARQKRLNALSKLYGLQHLLRSKFVTDLVELLPEQNLKLNLVNSGFESAKRNIVLQIAGEFEVPIRSIRQISRVDGTQSEMILYDWPKDMTAIDSAQNRRLATIASETYEDLLDILLPHQLIFLKQAVKRVKTRYCGPYQDLNFGEMKDLLGLDEDQMSELKRTAEEANKFLCRKSRKTRDEAIGEILGELPAEIRLPVLRALGKPLAHGHCDLANLAEAFANVSNDED